MVQSLTSKNILIVGAGGIGCEFVKNLSKSAIKRFTLVDFDHIEETNLNRTFYFRSEHTNQSKS